MEETKDNSPSGLNLWQKICLANKRIGWIEKGGKNTMQNYDYVRAVDIFAEVRTITAELGICFEPSVQGSVIVAGQNKNGNNIYQFSGDLTVTVRNADNPTECFIIKTPGSALDNGDKAPWKGITGMLKYALIQVFLIPTGDDPSPNTGAIDPESNDADPVVPKAKAAPPPPPALPTLKFSVPLTETKAIAFFEAKFGPCWEETPSGKSWGLAMDPLQVPAKLKQFLI